MYAYILYNNNKTTNIEERKREREKERMRERKRERENEREKERKRERENERKKENIEKIQLDSELHVHISYGLLWCYMLLIQQPVPTFILFLFLSEYIYIYIYIYSTQSIHSFIRSICFIHTLSIALFVGSC